MELISKVGKLSKYKHNEFEISLWEGGCIVIKSDETFLRVDNNPKNRKILFDEFTDNPKKEKDRSDCILTFNKVGSDFFQEFTHCDIQQINDQEFVIDFNKDTFPIYKDKHGVLIIGSETKTKHHNLKPLTRYEVSDINGKNIFIQEISQINIENLFKQNENLQLTFY